MNQDEIDGINGRMAALSSALTAIISSLPPEQAARAALELKMTNESDKQYDAEDETPPTQATARDTTVEALLQLLSAVAKRG